VTLCSSFPVTRLLVMGAIGIKVKGGLVPPYSSTPLRRIKLPEQRLPFE
jgi:hypothetical protein